MEMSAAIYNAVFPLMRQTVKAIAEQGADDWRDAVKNAHLSQYDRLAYEKSITVEQTGDFSAFVYSDYKYASDIETGRPPRDLKKMLDTSSKVRRTKDGRRFLVIPMRHGSPKSNTNPMPSGVAKLAKAMTPSKVLSTGMRPSGQVTHLSPTSGMSAAAKQTPFLSNVATKSKMLTENRNYQWGDRLSRAALKEAGMSKAEQRKYSGMVRMDTSTPGGKKSSSFLTFRIMAENSRGWIIPAQPGQYILRGVATNLEPKAAAAFAAAVARTVKA